MHENDNLLEKAAREIALLDAEIKEATERRDLLKSYFKNPDQYPPGKYTMGDYTIVVSTNQRISQKKAELYLLPITLEAVSTPKVDAKKARAMLDPGVLEMIMDNYDHRIEVRRNG